MDIKPNWLDRIFMFFSPIAGFRRIQARAATQVIRGYDGASKGRRTKNWNPGNKDADMEISSALSTLRSRSRDLVRNNSHAAKAVTTIVSNCVGTGIVLKLGDKTAEQDWKDWANGKGCDYDGQMDFYSLQSLAFRALVQDGEFLVLRKRSTSKEYPLQIQLLEADYLDTTKYDLDKRIRDGIEFDTKGRIIAYWLWEEHPGGRNLNIKNRFQSKRVLAEDIIHCYRKDRPGQIRGVPWVAPTMMTLRDLSNYEDAQLEKQKVSACFVGFMRNTSDPITQTVAEGEETKPLSQRFEPGSWEVLPDGKDIVFGNPPAVGGEYDVYVRRCLLSVASGFGISYESLTGDFGNVNFSSGRMGWIEMHRNIEKWRWCTFIPGFCDPILDWWLEARQIASGKQMKEGTEKTWTAPRREMIDPVKEVGAMKDAVRSGFSTLSGALRELGLDPQTHLQEYAADNSVLDELKLTFDTDPRVELKTKQQGQNGSNQANQARTNR